MCAQSQDTAVRQLADSLFMRNDDLMALMSVYFDDSGTHQQSEIAIAACLISDVARWSDFELEWKAILEQRGILEHGFHMAEFVAKQPPFDWSDEIRDDTIQRLIAILIKFSLAARASSVVKKDYDSLIVGRLREKLGHHHYTYAVQSCLAYIEEWEKTSLLLQPTAYWFDQMTKGKGEIIRLFDDLLEFDKADNFGIEQYGWGFYNRRLVVPLQAADILAWESNKYMREYQPFGIEPRRSFRAIVAGLDFHGRFYDASNLSIVAEKNTAYYDKVGWDKSPRGGFFKTDPEFNPL